MLVKPNLAGTKQGEETMACKQCDSEKQREFGGEIAIHYRGLKGLDKPIVMLFPKLLVCLDCGFTEFSVPENDLRLLNHGTPATLRFGGETTS